MKLTKRLTLLALVALSGFTAVAQGYLEDPKFGSNPAEREENVKNLNIFMSAYKSDQHDQAISYMWDLIKKAPKSNINLYVNGANIYKGKVRNAQNPKEKQAMVDTVMMIYDIRAEHFPYCRGNQGKHFVMGRKAIDYMALAPNDRRGIRKHFKNAVDIAKDSVADDIMANYLNILAEDYQMDSVETVEFLNEYEKISELLDRKPKNDETAETRKMIDAIFVNSGVASCENIEAIFKPRYQATPNDVELMKKILGLMARNKCNGEFMNTVAENYYKVDPTPGAAAMLASSFEQKKEYDKAIQYLNDAVASETNVAAKANYMVRIASAYLDMKQYQTAANHAKQAISVNSENGYAYIILAQAYANGASCTEKLARQSVFWIVVDTLNEAKRNLAGDSSQLETVNTLIRTYSSNFPDSEECFFYNLENGQTYTVNCGWVSGRTTVRIR